MNKLFMLCVAISVALAFPRKGKYPFTDTIDPDAVTVKIVEGEENALGTCTCDITRNACDAYCCCDTDCGTLIQDEWKSRYDLICAKNYIGREIAPKQRCLGD